MSEDETISLSESEGEGPNIRPPQHVTEAGVKKHHKSHKGSRGEYSRHGRGEHKEHRRSKEGGEGRKRDRERRKDGSRRGDRRDRGGDRDRRGGGGGHEMGDLRHRLNRDRERYSGGEGGRYDRSRGDQERGHQGVGQDEVRREGDHEERMNKILRANKHMEESRRDLEARKRRKVIEKEMEKLRAAVKRKVRTRSRSGSRDKRKKKKSSDTGDESREEESDDEDAVSGEESAEEGSEEGEEGSDSDAAASDATTGTQKSEETPDREESGEEGEIDDDELEEEGEKIDDIHQRKERSRSQTPVEGRWADRSSSRSGSRTPSRSPTPMREDTPASPEGDRRSGGSPPPALPQTGAESPSDLLIPPPSESPAPPPVLPGLPPYLPSVHGCRSVAEFKCLNRIEEGTYGVVYRAMDKRTKEIVALKRLKMEREKEGFPITSLREINTLLISQHPNVVHVREIVVGSNMDQIYIVMDFVQHDLKSLMETMRKKSQVFLPGEVKCLMVQLMRAIHHLHDNWILHRDLKASNLLLSHKGILKVGDFGLAREYGSPLKNYTAIVVTLWYRAPELLLGTKPYSTPIDCWSVGCILGELLLMEPLFPGKSEVDELNKIFKLLGTPSEKIWPGYNKLPGVQRMKFIDSPASKLRDTFSEKMLSETGLSLLKGLLTYNPAQRMSCDAALKSEYFRENPLPIDPSMFPTWPAKSEQDPEDKLKKGGNSPPPPSGGGAFKNMNKGDEDEERAAIRSTTGFDLVAAVRNAPPAAGWNLKF